MFNIKRGVEAGKKDDSIVDYPTTHKLLRGQDISSYNITFAQKYILFDNYNTTKFKEASLYENPKILIRRVSNQIQATYDDSGYVVLNTIYCLDCKKHKKNQLKYYIGILNSRLISYWFMKTFCNTDKLFPYIRTSQLNQIPLPNDNRDCRNKIIDLVDTILSIKCNNPFANTKCYELQIDNLVYHLYNLTYDEICVIDPETLITREEYEFEKQRLETTH